MERKNNAADMTCELRNLLDNALFLLADKSYGAPYVKTVGFQHIIIRKLCIDYTASYDIELE